MTDNILRHLVSSLATIICLLAYVAGYISGGYGWWGTVFALVFVYAFVHKMINVGH